MELFTRTPERILGNIAVASVLGGVPMGLALATLAALTLPGNDTMPEFLIHIGKGALLGPILILMCGLCVIAPLMTLLRYLGYGGPFFVYAISLAVALLLFRDGWRAGLVALALGMAASYVFCRFAYLDDMDFADL